MNCGFCLRSLLSLSLSLCGCRGFLGRICITSFRAGASRRRALAQRRRRRGGVAGRLARRQRVGRSFALQFRHADAGSRYGATPERAFWLLSLLVTFRTDRDLQQIDPNPIGQQKLRVL